VPAHTHRYVDRHLQNSSRLVDRVGNSDARPDARTGPVLQADRTARDQGGEVWIFGVVGVVLDC